MLTYLWISLGLIFGTFLFFLAVMKLRDAKEADTLKDLNKSVIWMAYIILFIGLVLDVALNWVVMTIWFLELPKELLTTSRVKRLKNHGSGWGKKQATWICANFLTPFDPKHCLE